MKRDVIKETMHGWQEETPNNIKNAMKGTLRHLPEKRRSSKKALTAIAACACAVIILLATPVGSYALEAIEDVFGLFAQQRYANEADNDVMAQLEQNAGRPEQQVVIPGGGEQDISVDIDGVFYDGEQLVLSYAIQGRKSFDITYIPTEEELAQMEPVGENGIEPADATEKDMAAVKEKIENGQPTGWRSYDVFIDDGTYTNDGLNVPASTDDYFWNGDEKIGVRFFELTDELKSRDRLTLEIGFTVYESCYYFDGSEEYFSSKKCESLTVEASADKQQAVEAQGSAEFTDYSAQAYMTLSPAFISAEVRLTPKGDESVKQAWLDHYKNESDLENVPTGYEVLDSEGNVIAQDANVSLRVTETQAEINIRFAAVENLPSQLILHPTFANGVSLNEDIIINLP